MRKAFISAILISLICNGSFAQTQELPSDSLIKKYKVKTITCYSHYEITNPNIVSYIKIWKYDTLGRLYFEHLIDNDTSKDRLTSFDGSEYFYNENKLKERWDIGVWNVKTMKVDTAATNYFYNEIDSLIEVIYKNPVVGSHSIKFNYQNGHLVKKTYKNISRGFIYDSDSIVYLKNGKIYMDYNNQQGFRDTYKYNNKGQLIRITNTSIKDISIVTEIHKYYYRREQLTKEIRQSADALNSYKEMLPKDVYCYYYYKNGLLKEIRELTDNESKEKYEYEFY